MVWKWSARFPKACRPSSLPDFSLVAKLWPGAVGIALMSFTETVAAGRAFAASGEPPLATEPGTTGDRTRECVRRASGGHAGGRRHHTDSGKPSCRRAHAGGGACHSGSRAADDASSCPSHRADASSHPCCRGHRLLDRNDQAGRFPRHPPRSDERSSSGP